MKFIKAATIQAIEAQSVDVEASFTNGLPSFTIVGLASSNIQEAKDRVKSSLLTNDFKFPPKKITINLSPSEINKSGTHFDLSIALLIALYESNFSFGEFFVLGELGLDGSIKDSSNIFPIVLSLAKQKILKKVVVCENSAKKIANIPNIEVYCVNSLKSAICFFSENKKELYKYKSETLSCQKVKVNDEAYYYLKEYEYDFNDVKGQNLAIEAALISSAGNHNILFEGSAGCGKSMISKRIQYIMPPMCLEEILEKAKLQSFDFNKVEFSSKRVLRNPHHSATKSSIFGGGSGYNAKIGEVALANNGILFFDELPHFGKNILEALREPLEDNKILISRVNFKTMYDTKFLFIAAMNPCPCGNLLSTTKDCRCTQAEIQKYKNKLSEPLLDRIDLYVCMNESNANDKACFSSESLHEKVINAFVLQKQRGQKELNGKLNDKEISKYCILNEEAKDIFAKAITNFKLSFRAQNRVIKVARTVADLNNNKDILKSDILKALSYRKR